LDELETENYIIYRDARKLPNWYEYYQSIVKYQESDGSTFGSALYRGGGPFSSVGDGKGIYLDVVAGSTYVLIFPIGKHDFKNPRLGCILIKNEAPPETGQLLISSDDIRKTFPPGIYGVFGFKNQELILKQTYWISLVN
jgi:hypothetical protein